jgi:hypothetical protein
MRRITLIAVASLLALVAFAGTALAKEGAVTKFDKLPGDWHAGQTYALGYTILMDGQEPYKADTTEIVVRNTTGKVLSYPGTADGAPGHYVAKVYFPAAGTYTWQVTQGSFFAPMDLGRITVLGPVTSSAEQAAPATAPAPSPAPDPVAIAAGLVAALAAFGGALRLTQLVRGQRRTAANA